MLNHLLDILMDMPFFASSFMGKPSDRPEFPPIIVNSLQVELLVMLQDTFVHKLEHVPMPSTANLHQDCVAAS